MFILYINKTINLRWFDSSLKDSESTCSSSSSSEESSVDRNLVDTCGVCLRPHNRNLNDISELFVQCTCGRKGKIAFYIELYWTTPALQGEQTTIPTNCIFLSHLFSMLLVFLFLPSYRNFLHLKQKSTKSLENYGQQMRRLQKCFLSLCFI